MRSWRRTAAFGPNPDFLPPPARPPWLAWLWLACGALVLAFAADDWLALDAARSDARSQLQRIPTAPRTAATPRNGGVASRGAQAAANATAQDIARRLDHPWPGLFEDIERAAAPGVHWLRLEHDAERGNVRLEANATSRGAVLTTLDALASAPGWRDVMLVRLEAAEPAARPDAALRFELRARHGAQAAAWVDTP